MIYPDYKSLSIPGIRNYSAHTLATNHKVIPLLSDMSVRLYADRTTERRTEVREAYFLLGHFAIGNTLRNLDRPKGTNADLLNAFSRFLEENIALPGGNTLKKIFHYATRHCGVNSVEWLSEICCGVLGEAGYGEGTVPPVCSRVMDRYYGYTGDNFTIRGMNPTANGIEEVITMLFYRGLIERGDKIALGVAFTERTPASYVLRKFRIKTVRVNGIIRHSNNNFHLDFPEEELQKLQGSRALLISSPHTHPALELSSKTHERLRRSPMFENTIVVGDNCCGTARSGHLALLSGPQQVLASLHALLVMSERLRGKNRCSSIGVGRAVG